MCACAMMFRLLWAIVKVKVTVGLEVGLYGIRFRVRDTFTVVTS